MSSSSPKTLPHSPGDAAPVTASSLLELPRRLLLKGGFLASTLLLLLATGAAVKQWHDQPISIMPFAVSGETAYAGVSAAALADQVKAHISAIYGGSGDLFEIRKLGEPTVPLNVQIAGTGLRLQSLVSTFGLSLSAAEVKARLVPDGDKVLLQWTTIRPGVITVDDYPLDTTQVSRLAAIDQALFCLALRTVASVSPDVAANYGHTQEEAAGVPAGAAATRRCLDADDTQLYSRVSTDVAAPAAARVNALVGLSVHFSYSHQVTEELDMALAATHLAAQLLTCDDAAALPTWSSRVRCRVAAHETFGDRKRRAAVAAWMQLGAAYSDYAASASTLGEMLARRGDAIGAYERAIRINPNYAPAYNAKGLQQAFSSRPGEAAQSYRRSLETSETAQARLDSAYLDLHGRNDAFDEIALGARELEAAEQGFQRAVELQPDYWDAHAGLGYALYLRGKLPEAADVLEATVEHDAGNRPLRRLLGAVYAGLCRLDTAQSRYQAAYSRAVAQKQDDLALDLAADWGIVLQRAGLASAALAQAQAVLATSPTDATALVLRGESRIALSGEDPTLLEQGMTDLRSASEQGTGRSDAVLATYLVQLDRAHRFGEAMAAYEAWSRAGLVPPRAGSSLSDAGIQPVVPRARLGYARSLLSDGRWAAALPELEVLAGTGSPVRATDIETLQRDAASDAADPSALRRIEALRTAAIPAPAPVPRTPCVAPALPPIVLTALAP